MDYKKTGVFATQEEIKEIRTAWTGASIGFNPYTQAIRQIEAQKFCNKT